MRFTVLGARGFIGSALVARLRVDGHDVDTPASAAAVDREPGHLVYAIGVTSDFRHRPMETVDAHVCVLRDVLTGGRFDSLLYLSSTRVYGDVPDAREVATIEVRPTDPDHLYNLSKLLGESMCLALDHPGLRVVRLSNVYGRGASSATFLGDVLAQSATGSVRLGQALTSSKDYVSIDDVADVLPRIALEGRQRLYNVARGEPVTHEQLLDALAEVRPLDVVLTPGAPEVRGPSVSIERVRDELGFAPRSVLDDLGRLLEER